MSDKTKPNKQLTSKSVLGADWKPRAKSASQMSSAIKEAIEKTRKLGPSDPSFDQKKFFDEEWGD